MNIQVLSILKNIFTTHFMIRTNTLTYRQKLGKDLSLNEYEVNEVLLYLESEFQINMDDQEISQLRTIGDLVHCVERHQD